MRCWLYNGFHWSRDLIRGMEARRRADDECWRVLLLNAQLPPAQDLPVCFPGRPCMDFTPLGADVINLTSALTPASQAIEIGCLIALGLGLVAVVLGLRSRPIQPGPSPWLVVLSAALLLLGSAATSAVDNRFGAISLIYGPDPGAISALIGSWPEVRLAGDALALLGILALITTASLATVRLRRMRTQ